MNKIKVLVFTVSVSLFALFACNSQNQSVKMESEIDSVSYSIGVNLGKSFTDDFQKRGLDSVIQNDLILQGLSDFFDGNEKIDHKTAYVTINKYFMALNENMRKKEHEGSILEGQRFLEENKAKDGVVTLESGLQYKVLVEGNGPKPKATDKVKVHYIGTAINGDVFESSVEKGTPVEFQVTGVIKGWTEALQLMPVGSKWMLYVPENLAYGANPRPGPIKPYQMLIFEVELLEILK